MKRSSFLKSLSISITSLFFLKKSFGKSVDRVQKAVMVQAGHDRNGTPITLFEGDRFFSKLSGRDTDGDLYIFDSIRMKEGGPPLHVHAEQDEWWYVLSGAYLIRVGDETFHAEAGDCVFGPRGIPHAFAKTGKQESRLLIVFQPAGSMEDYFAAISSGKVAKMTQEEQILFRKQHGIVHVGPPLTQLKRS